MIQLGLRFAKIERNLGEIERARRIYAHIAQFCRPDSKAEWPSLFWQLWEQFELQAGDDDTFADFSRTKRATQLRFSTVTNDE